MSMVNNVQENIISGEIKPRRIKSQGNSCPGGKFWRKTYREEKVWGKDGAKPFYLLGSGITNHVNYGPLA